MPVLDFLKGVNQGTKREVAGDRIVFGRNADCQVCLNAPAVSRPRYAGAIADPPHRGHAGSGRSGRGSGGNAGPSGSPRRKGQRPWLRSLLLASLACLARGERLMSKRST